jgi:hypothetical protein
MASAGFQRRRLARTHDAVDVEQRVLAALVLVDRQRVADVAADIDVVDVEDRQLFEAGLAAAFRVFSSISSPASSVDLAGRG